MSKKTKQKIKWTTEQVQQICSQLLGTCGSLDTKLEEVFGGVTEDMPIDMLHAIDDQIWLCAVCDWWVEPSELSGDGACGDCR